MVLYRIEAINWQHLDQKDPWVYLILSALYFSKSEILAKKFEIGIFYIKIHKYKPLLFLCENEANFYSNGKFTP